MHYCRHLCHLSPLLFLRPMPPANDDLVWHSSLSMGDQMTGYHRSDQWGHQHRTLFLLHEIPSPQGTGSKGWPIFIQRLCDSDDPNLSLICGAVRPAHHCACPHIILPYSPSLMVFPSRMHKGVKRIHGDIDLIADAIVQPAPLYDSCAALLLCLPLFYFLRGFF